MAYNTFYYNQEFTLENGHTLPCYHLAYHTYGVLNKAGDNAVWVFHALTANSDVTTWWPGLVGEGMLLDPRKYFIVCVNMPGSCYGSIGPLDKIPGTEETFYHRFPFFTTRDMVRAYQPLKDFLGIIKVHIGIGGSMGGQQLLEWAIEEPELFEHIVPIATNAYHSAWAKAFNASQRWCIEADKSWNEENENAGIEGMKIARSVALISYRHYQTYEVYQAEDNAELLQGYRSESYQKYQGEKLAKRFNAFSYYKLLQSMDSHHIGRKRGNSINAMQQITAKTLIIGIRSDVLFPTVEQQYLAINIPGAQLSLIDSIYGHDGFLLAAEPITSSISTFLKQKYYKESFLPNKNGADSKLLSKKQELN